MFTKRKRKPDQPPKWFRDFVEKDFKPEIKLINVRLDNLETRLDNLVTKNHLVE